MKQPNHLFRRGNGNFDCREVEKNRQTSVQTGDLALAQRLVNVKNEACRQPAMNLEMARVWLNHGDPSHITRTGQLVMDEMTRLLPDCPMTTFGSEF